MRNVFNDLLAIGASVLPIFLIIREMLFTVDQGVSTKNWLSLVQNCFWYGLSTAKPQEWVSSGLKSGGKPSIEIRKEAFWIPGL